MKVIKRVPITLDHVKVLVDYGFYVGYKAAVESSPFNETIQQDLCAVAYERYMRPIGTTLRGMLGIDNAVAIDLGSEEILVLDTVASEVNYHNAQDFTEGEGVNE